jgi:uncharacterized protein with GYD domain
VNQEISEFGCRVVTQYAVLGGYDFVTIVDAPDKETVAHMSIDLSSRGTVKDHNPTGDTDCRARSGARR